MTNSLLWTLIFVQMILGVSDTLFHHEATERLAWRPTQKNELRLHGARNLVYSVIFLTLGWLVPNGAFAAALIAAFGVEVFITLWDFVEEDRSRKLPPSERVLHTLMALNYGAVLAFLIPVLAGWAGAPTSLAPAYYGVWSWLCLVAGVGTAIFGARDFAAAARASRLAPSLAAGLACGLKARRRVLVTGATGFIGRRLVEALSGAGHEVTALVRNPDKARVLPAPVRIVTALDQIGNDDRIDAIVHLAGEPVANGLWTERKKRRIVDSRVGLTNDLIELAERAQTKPAVFISASAVGWYGMRDETPLTETHRPDTQSFSHRSCEAAEQAARKMERCGVRTACLRIGLVLGVEGGLLARLLTPFEFGLGGPFGDGSQMMSWITRDDLVRLIVYVMRNETLAGPINATAPQAVSNETFSKTLAAALGRPAWFRIPAAPLRLALGAFAEELFLGGQNVKPEKALAAGFVFASPTLEEAFASMLGGARKSASVHAFETPVEEVEDQPVAVNLVGG